MKLRDAIGTAMLVWAAGVAHAAGPDAQPQRRAGLWDTTLKSGFGGRGRT